MATEYSKRYRWVQEMGTDFSMCFAKHGSRSHNDLAHLKYRQEVEIDTWFRKDMAEDAAGDHDLPTVWGEYRTCGTNEFTDRDADGDRSGANSDGKSRARSVCIGRKKETTAGTTRWPPRCGTA